MCPCSYNPLMPVQSSLPEGRKIKGERVNRKTEQVSGNSGRQDARKPY